MEGLPVFFRVRLPQIVAFRANKPQMAGQTLAFGVIPPQTRVRIAFVNYRRELVDPEVVFI